MLVFSLLHLRKGWLAELGVQETRRALKGGEHTVRFFKTRVGIPHAVWISNPSFVPSVVTRAGQGFPSETVRRIMWNHEARVVDLYLVSVQALLALSIPHSLTQNLLLDILDRLLVLDVLLLQVLQVDLSERIPRPFLPMPRALLLLDLLPQKGISPTHPLCQSALREQARGRRAQTPGELYERGQNPSEEINPLEPWHHFRCKKFHKFCRRSSCLRGCLSAVMKINGRFSRSTWLPWNFTAFGYTLRFLCIFTDYRIQ